VTAISQLVEQISRGDVRALARAMTLVETGGQDGSTLLAALPPLPQESRSKVIGITGLPGGGKSTLIDHMIEEYRGRAGKVGVVAVDPSSPVHGGALLGDRLRLMRHATSPGVFIRSMASRGALGGLNPAVAGVVAVMTAGGCNPILVETVGLGQIGWDIFSLADMVVAVTAPGLGDEVQMMKSGLLDIVDLLVLNKVDLPGAEGTRLSLLSELEHRHLPMLETSAATGAGIAALVEHIDLHLRQTSKKGAELVDNRAVTEARIVEKALSLVRPHFAARVASLPLDQSPDVMALRLVEEMFTVQGDQKIPTR